jgi:hypothetical protein
MAFDPENGLKSKEHYVTTPVSEEEARAQIQSISDQLKGYLNETLLAELENTQLGQSGAEMIGSAAIACVAGETVRAQIEDVKRQIDNVSTGSVTDGAVATEKLADGAVTKPKLDGGALDWTLVIDSGLLNTSGGFEIGAQTGKSEIMIQLRNEDGSMVNGFAILPLGENGMMTPSSVKVMGCDPYDFSVDSRTFTMSSDTLIIYGMSSAECMNGVTSLKRAYVFVR